MRVSQELITVLSDATVNEVSILLAGMRITMTEDEARLFSRELVSALDRFVAPDRVVPDFEGTATTPAAPSRDHPSEEKERAGSGMRSILSKAR